jgi:hypothetical protein
MNKCQVNVSKFKHKGNTKDFFQGLADATIAAAVHKNKDCVPKTSNAGKICGIHMLHPI